MDIRSAERLCSSCYLPWQKKAHYDDFETDTKEQIMMCLNCCKEECDNCIEKPKKKGRPCKADTSLIQTMIDSHMSVKAICEALNVSRKTVYNYKNSLKKGKENESK